jgi:hypothetical protein
VGVLALEAALFRQPAVVGVAIALAVLELAVPRLAPGLVIVRALAPRLAVPQLDARPQLVALVTALAAALGLVAAGAEAVGYGVAAGAGAAALVGALLARAPRR